MLRRYRSGQPVEGGVYWNLRTGECSTIDGKEGFLPSGEGEYVRAHPAVVFLLGPWLGLAYIIFLPLAVPALVLSLLARQARRGMASAWQRVQASFPTHVNGHRS
ncbi:MAG TPA: hypothetical protein VJM69_02890 [Dehalococcoidia bacterium]|nr:hypothetical protein [Dehalococcoidia bacterium]